MAAPPHRALTLAGDALRALRTHALRLAPLLLAFAALHLVSDWASVMHPPGGQGLGALAEVQTRGVANHLGVGLLMGLSIRVLLNRPPVRPIAGLAGYAGLVAAAAFAQALPFLAVGNLRLFAAEDPGALALRLLAVSLAVVAPLLIYIRLVLWPVGVLTGEPIRPARSWRLMRGATLRFLGAAALLAAPPLAVSTVTGFAFIKDHNLPAELVAVVFAALANLAVAAVTAAVFAEKANQSLGRPPTP